MASTPPTQSPRTDAAGRDSDGDAVDVRRIADLLDSPLFREVGRLKSTRRDAKIVICANAETGVGKTSLAVFLGRILDTSPAGFVVDEQATLDTTEYRKAFDEIERGSTLVLDEAEQLDARRAMSQDNVDTAFSWQTKRIREVTTILTLPTWGDLEKRLREMADIRIEILRRGEALVHFRDRDRYETSGVFWRPVQTLEWPNMDPDPAFKELERMKEEFLGDEDGRKLLTEEEAQERINEATEETRRDAKIWKAKALYHADGLTQQEVADEFGVTQSAVCQWLQE